MGLHYTNNACLTYRNVKGQLKAVKNNNCLTIEDGCVKATKVLNIDDELFFGYKDGEHNEGRNQTVTKEEGTSGKINGSDEAAEEGESTRKTPSRKAKQKIKIETLKPPPKAAPKTASTPKTAPKSSGKGKGRTKSATKSAIKSVGKSTATPRGRKGYVRSGRSTGAGSGNKRSKGSSPESGAEFRYVSRRVAEAIQASDEGF